MLHAQEDGTRILVGEQCCGPQRTSWNEGLERLGCWRAADSQTLVLERAAHGCTWTCARWQSNQLQTSTRTGGVWKQMYFSVRMWNIRPACPSKPPVPTCLLYPTQAAAGERRPVSPDHQRQQHLGMSPSLPSQTERKIRDTRGAC